MGTAYRGGQAAGCRYQYTMIETTATGKGKRTRQSQAGFAGLPALREVQRIVLLRWVASHAKERAWQSLLNEAGTEYLDHAETLLQSLLEAGALQVKQVFKNGQWWPQRIVWTDLPQLQKTCGIQPATERDAQRLDLLQKLQNLASAQPWAASAVQSSLALPTASLVARAQLLQALAEWHAEQRFGLRQDFALFAREHTKDIKPHEWAWLEAHCDLEGLGIGRFEPLLWLGGALRLQGPNGQLDAAALGWAAIPARRLDARMTVATSPARYWLIENRASFERCAVKAPTDHCVVWLPGRPSQDWLKAMQWLLEQAPAPADISCDPDPAGIEIALTAGQLWMQRGLVWRCTHMAPEVWQSGKTLPLTHYDRQTLERLALRIDLPTDLVVLRDYLHRTACKAEQEGWL
jgi:hypothetical protein